MKSDFFVISECIDMHAICLSIKLSFLMKIITLFFKIELTEGGLGGGHGGGHGHGGGEEHFVHVSHDHHHHGAIGHGGGGGGGHGHGGGGPTIVKGNRLET